MASASPPPVRPLSEMEDDIHVTAHLSRVLDLALLWVGENECDQNDIAAFCHVSRIVSAAAERVVKDFRALDKAGDLVAARAAGQAASREGRRS